MVVATHISTVLSEVPPTERPRLLPCFRPPAQELTGDVTAAMLGELDWSSPAAHDAAAVDVYLLLVFLSMQVRGF